MISIHKNRVTELISFYEKEINEYQSKALNNIKKLKKNRYLNTKERTFLGNIIREFKTQNFITIPNENFTRTISRIGEIPNKRKIKFGRTKKETFLKDEILHALDYSSKRSVFYPKYFQKLGIKTCVYCNSQLTITIEKKYSKTETEYTAKFQVDHYYPKSKYPYLSIALFNLYPVCEPCNLIKSNNEISFKLYSKSIDNDIFQFKIDKASKAKFLITRDIDDLKIIFNKNGDETYDGVFKISEIYETQKDIAEEILLKALAYNEPHRNDLKNILGKHKINDSLINRFILGNYTEPNEIHKRPMSKFMQDIGREAGLIE